MTQTVRTGCYWGFLGALHRTINEPAPVLLGLTLRELVVRLVLLNS